ncbi:MAG: hypothetical protein IPK81_08930 [Rhodospirillales bacterium]|nr:MAG: hypothetical protein IPK81_08930 [Rhodospirillales bacterium]
MNWATFWSSLLGTAIPGVIASVIVLFLSRRITKSIETFKKDLQQDIVKFTKLHEKRLESLIEIYNAFADYLDFMRKALYVKNTGVNMDPMHKFHDIILRQSVYLDESMASKFARYQGELLQFWNKSHEDISTKGDVGREEVRHRLDYEIPKYLPQLRKDINEYLDPNYRARLVEH